MAIHVPGWTAITNSSTQSAAAIDTVHADTGSITAGQGGVYQIIAMVGGEIGSLWEVEHRNAANASNVAAHRVRTVAGETLQFVLWLDLRSGERARVVNKTAFGAGPPAETSEGTIQAMRLK